MSVSNDDDVGGDGKDYGGNDEVVSMIISDEYDD